MGSYEVLWAKLKFYFEGFLRDLSIWLDRLTLGQTLIGIALFALVLMLFMARRKRMGVDKGSPVFQFIFAMAIVVFISFGATWLFAPDPVVDQGLELLRR